MGGNLLDRIKARFRSVINRIIDDQVALLKPSQVVDFEKRNIVVMRNTFVSEDSIIGDYSYVGYNTSISKAIVGRYCSIANNVSIGNGEHLIHRVSTSSLFYEKPYETLTEKDCVVGNDVWIGVDCVIRRGVRIGNGAIIGANSFVNRDVPDFMIVAGSPARIVTPRFDQEIINKINESKWWDMPLDEARKVIDELQKYIDENSKGK